MLGVSEELRCSTLWFTLGVVMAKETTSLSFMTSVTCFKDPSFNNPKHESIWGAFSSADLGIYLNMEEERINKSAV